MSFSIIISVGGYGGFYISKCAEKPIAGQERRICLGWVAISLLTPEFDTYLDNIMKIIVGEKWEKFTNKDVERVWNGGQKEEG